MALYRVFEGFGADMIGDWPINDYQFENSASVRDGRFVGLVIDQRTQGMYTEERLNTWVEQIKPQLLESLEQAA
jgi:flavodoxin I